MGWLLQKENFSELKLHFLIVPSIANAALPRGTNRGKGGVITATYLILIIQAWQLTPDVRQNN